MKNLSNSVFSSGKLLSYKGERWWIYEYNCNFDWWWSGKSSGYILLVAEKQPRYNFYYHNDLLRFEDRKRKEEKIIFDDHEIINCKECGSEQLVLIQLGKGELVMKPDDCCKVTWMVLNKGAWVGHGFETCTDAGAFIADKIVNGQSRNDFRIFRATEVFFDVKIKAEVIVQCP